MMISHGVEISIAGDGADEKDGRKQGAFFFYNHVFVVKVQETAWSASYDVNKTINNLTTRFTPSWEKSTPSNPKHTTPPNST